MFSATDSSDARVRPAPSSQAGSRPHSDGSNRRAPSMSPRSSSSDMAKPVRANEVPPSETQVAAAVAAIDQGRPPRSAVRCSAAPSRLTAPTSTPTCTAPAALLSR